MNKRGKNAQRKGFNQKQFERILEHGFNNRSNFSFQNTNTNSNVRTDSITLFPSSAPFPVMGSNINKQTQQFANDGTPTDSAFYKELNIPSAQSLIATTHHSSSPDATYRQSTTFSDPSVPTSQSSDLSTSANQSCPSISDQESELNQQVASQSLNDYMPRQCEKISFEGNSIYPKFEFTPLTVSSPDVKMQELIRVKNDLMAQFRAQDSYFIPSGKSAPPIFSEGFKTAPARSMTINWQFIPVELRPEKLRKEAIRKVQAAKLEKKRDSRNNTESVLERLEMKEDRGEDGENTEKNQTKEDDVIKDEGKPENDDEFDDELAHEDDEFGDELVFERCDDDEDNYDMGDDGDDDGPIF